MNDRIKELWEKAATASAAYPSGQNNSWETQVNFMDKFAELIVRECADIAYKTSWVDLVHGYGRAVIPLHLHNTIKEHFGVEE